MSLFDDARVNAKTA